MCVTRGAGFLLSFSVPIVVFLLSFFPPLSFLFALPPPSFPTYHVPFLLSPHFPSYLPPPSFHLAPTTPDLPHTHLSPSSLSHLLR